MAVKYLVVTINRGDVLGDVIPYKTFEDAEEKRDELDDTAMFDHSLRDTRYFVYEQVRIDWFSRACFKFFDWLDNKAATA